MPTARPILTFHRLRNRLLYLRSTTALLVTVWNGTPRLLGDAADSVVVFNEIQYQPENETFQPEWIELHNLMGVTIDLSGWQLEGAGELTFAEGTRIPGRAFLLLSTNPDDPLFDGRQVYQAPLTGRLANEGETLLLRNRSGRVMDRVRYRPSGDWPVGAAGSGAALAKRHENSADSSPKNWVASPRLGGTPGTWNVPPEPAQAITVPFISADAEWRYFNIGRPAPPDWMSPQFNNSTWPIGKSPFRAGETSDLVEPAPLFAYWRLDNEDGRTATELVSGVQSRLMNGAEWIIDAERGSVIEFDGDDGFVDTKVVIPQMTLENDFTWAFWAFSRKAANVHVIVGNRHRANGADFSPREFIKFTNGGLEFHRLGSGEDILYPPIPRNEWVHHALVKRGRSLLYYRNGTELGRQNLSAGLNNPQPLYFGGDQTRENWRGRLDEVGLWEAALDASTIVGLADGTYTPESAPAPANPIGSQTGTELPGVSATAYFVTEFTFDGDPGRTNLELSLLADDGAVIFLNGHEIHRFNVDDAPLGFNTLAKAPIGKAALSEPLNLPSDHLLIGRNTLAVTVHQATDMLTSEDLEFGLTLVGQEFPEQAPPPSPLKINEISPGNDDPFFVEVLNTGTTPLDLSTYEFHRSNGQYYPIGESEQLLPGQVLVINTLNMGLNPSSEDRLFLVDQSNRLLIDAVEVRDHLQARQPDKALSWYTPAAPSFGRMNPEPNAAPIVINEIMYHPMISAPDADNAGQWIELFNRSSEPIDIGGWRFDDGVQFVFPSETILGPSQFLLVVGDRVGFEQIYPQRHVTGEWSGSLSRRGERLRLVDSVGNRVDEVSYFDGGHWPARADGGGSSLELQDPRSDNQAPESWSASVTDGKWQEISYRGRGVSPSGDPTRYQEFVLGLLAAGECLVDDISVIEDPDGVARELIQNGDFEQGNTRFWRILGNHRMAEVIADPDQPGNRVLRVIATGPTEHMSNHLETTLRSGGSYIRVSDRHDYQISFRAKWIGGSNQLHSRLYFNRLARTTLLSTDRVGGSPGLANTVQLTNAGPTFARLSHLPVVPEPQESVTVQVEVQDPDGVSEVTLLYSIHGRQFRTLAMEQDGASWSATIPGQEIGSTIQFYVEARDGFDKTTFYPAGGPSSGAFIPIADGQADLDFGDCQPMNLRIAMKAEDIDRLHAPENVMSNERLPCSVIVDEREVYYNAGVRLKGSEHGRASDLRVSYNLRFPADHLFLGAHETIAIDRSGAGEQFSQREIMIKHAINHAGGIPGSYDDLIRVIAPRPQHTGSAMLSKSRFDREFLNNQFESGSDGSVYEYELVYVLSGTTGGVEGFKVTQPSEVHGVGVRNLGSNDKERYRWHWLLKNNRDADDFTPIINMVSAFGQSGDRFRQEVDQRLDVNQWLRAFAIQVLFGVADNYATGDQHNAMFYQRPIDGRMLYFPWDMDFTFIRGTSSDLTPNRELDQLIAASGVNRRNYYRHLWEIIQTTFNPDYLSDWTRHYSCFLPHEDLTRFDSYIRQRSRFALAEINRQVPPQPFRITTNDRTRVAETSITLEGQGWLDMAELRLVEGGTLSLEWIDWNRWQTSLPVRPGNNRFTLEALNQWGELVGSDTVEIIGTGSVLPASRANLAISELMYHPPAPDDREHSAGWTDPEYFEFIELVNLSSEFSIDLTGVAFTEGIRYNLPSTLVPPDGRVVLAGNLEAFQSRYGREIPVIGGFQQGAGNRLANAGEVLRLEDSIGETIAAFEWSDSAPWPSAADGLGYSLVFSRPGFDSPDSPASWRTSATIGGNPQRTDRLPISTWAEAFGVIDLTADIDGDGWSAAWEYLAGSHPGEPGSVPTVILAFDDDADLLVLELLTAVGTDDAIIQPQLSLDLESWTDGLTYLGREKHHDGRDWIRFASEVPVSEALMQYIRLNVTMTTSPFAEAE